MPRSKVDAKKKSPKKKATKKPAAWSAKPVPRAVKKKKAASSPAKRKSAPKVAASEASGDDVAAVLRSAIGAGDGITFLTRIEKPAQIIASDPMPPKAGTRKRRHPATFSIDLRGWPPVDVYRIDSGVVLAKHKTAPPKGPLDKDFAKALRNVPYASTLTRLGAFETQGGVLSLRPSGAQTTPEILKALDKLGKATVNGSALVYLVMGAGDRHEAVPVPNGVVLAAAPSTYHVFEEPNPINGKFGTIEKRILITHDPSIEAVND